MIAYQEISAEQIPLIQHIARETWPNTFGQMISAEQIEYMLNLMYNQQSLEKQMIELGHRFIVAFTEDKEIGFFAYETNYKGKPDLMIHKLYVMPVAQGLGVGTGFLSLLANIALMKNNNFLRLKVYIDNLRAIRFYEKSGFKKEGFAITDLGNNYIIKDHVMGKPLY